MKNEKIANYTAATFTCSQCSNSIETRSTGPRLSSVETCSNCHPAYTGQQRTGVSSNRIDDFNRRYRTAL